MNIWVILNLVLDRILFVDIKNWEASLTYLSCQGYIIHKFKRVKGSWWASFVFADLHSFQLLFGIMVPVLRNDYWINMMRMLQQSLDVFCEICFSCSRHACYTDKESFASLLIVGSSFFDGVNNLFKLGSLYNFEVISHELTHLVWFSDFHKFFIIWLLAQKIIDLGINKSIHGRLLFLKIVKTWQNQRIVPIILHMSHFCCHV